MGIVHRGIPKKRALEIVEDHGLRAFVETGTHIGNSAIWASHHFLTVQSIEVNKIYHTKASKLCRGHKNIHLYLADSATYLKPVLASLPTCALIWLDAHWSRDLEGEKPEKECPVLEEIKQIVADGRSHVVMIDDARLFGKNGWPTIDEIWVAFGSGWRGQVRDDVIEFFKDGGP